LALCGVLAAYSLFLSVFLKFFNCFFFLLLSRNASENAVASLGAYAQANSTHTYAHIHTHMLTYTHTHLATFTYAHLQRVTVSSDNDTAATTAQELAWKAGVFREKVSIVLFAS
jgi:hypothetical protein